MKEEAAPGCPECGGIGFRIFEEGGRSRARVCACRAKAPARQDSIEAFIAQARVPLRYRDCDFQSFAAGYGDDHAQILSLEAAKSLAQRYAEEYPLEERGLMFMGPPGVGKTHLAVAILRHLMTAKGVAGLFCDVQDLLRALQGTFDRPAGANEVELLHPVLTTEVVVLDDLGGRHPWPWVEETLAHIVTSRYNGRRATLVTTNYLDAPGKEGIVKLSDRIGPRVRSRLHEMCHLVRIEAHDFRSKVKLADHHRATHIAVRPRVGT